MRLARRSTIAAFAIALPLSLAACGSSDEDTTSGSTPSSETTSASPSESPSESMSSDAMAAEPFGPGCAAVPESGDGSFAGMATDPVATAASNNPELKTLVTAVGAAGLADTLNTAKDITVFAPINSAFAPPKLDKATLDKALGDPKGLLTKVLTNHVVEGRLAPDAVAGTHTTLGGGSITVGGSGEDFTIGEAKVVCGNVQTANATVYLIDGVLLPAS